MKTPVLHIPDTVNMAGYTKRTDFRISETIETVMSLKAGAHSGS